MVGAAWRISSGRDGPVLYRGVRVGIGGRPFVMYKFRTMVIDADRIGGPSTANDDPRLTAVGRTLRRYKLDELPQLFNVLRGDMSIVGPRPQVLEEVRLYSPEERQLLTVKPGITDWASLRFHNEGEILEGHTDPNLAYAQLIRPEKMRLALAYVRTGSVIEDVRIVLATARLAIRSIQERPAEPTS